MKYETDVVVIGAGGGGLAAAISASKAGGTSYINWKGRWFWRRIKSMYT